MTDVCAHGKSKAEASASFEQAKNPARGPQFLQIVAKPEPGARSRRSPSRS